jgi:hypothetical protein
MELDTWHEEGSRVWHVGWVDVDYHARSVCIGGCEHWHQIAEPKPPGARVCAKARKALQELLGTRYEIVEARLTPAEIRRRTGGGKRAGTD